MTQPMTQNAALGSSSFDVLLQEGTKTDAQPAASSTSSNVDGTAASELITQLLSAASKSPETTPESKVVDYSSLLTNPFSAVVPAPDPAEETTAATPAVKPTPTPAPAAAAQPVATEFLDSLANEQAVAQLIKGIQPVDFQLSTELNDMITDDTVGFNSEVMRQAIGLSMQQAQQVAMQQTIGIINGVIPDIIAKARHEALSEVNSSNQLVKAQESFKDNKPLQQLVTSLVGTRSVADGAETAAQVNALIADIVQTQIAANTAANPAPIVDKNKLFDDYLSSV